MGMTHTSMSHRAYMERPAQEAPPSIKIGMLVASQPLGLATSGTELRAKFAAFLGCPAVYHLIAALTDVEPDMSWKNLAGNGLRMLEAALTANDNPLDSVPTASALFLPPTPEESLYGRNGRAATLILYIEPCTADGQVPPASDLAAWCNRFRLALDVPQAFADFLAKDLELTTSDDPPAQLGIWLQSNQAMTTMINTDGLRTLPGSWPSNEFIGWALSAPDGDRASLTARDLVTQLCEYTLHLDAYEEALPQWKVDSPIIARSVSERTEAEIALANWLAALREREGITVSELAKRLNRPESIVAAYLTGQSFPYDRDRLELLLHELNANSEESDYAIACWADHRIGMAPKKPPKLSPRVRKV